jgi:phosphomannomutase/phosphoglucomutase
MNVSPSIFREYDIRGIAGTDFDPKVVQEYERWYGPFPGVTIDLATAEAIGNVYGQYIRERDGSEVIVGYENRPYADELKAAFIKGVLDTGVHVLDAGRTTTPLIYFLTSHLKLSGGVNITGSHNVYFYNGFKLVSMDSAPVYGNDLQKFYQQIHRDDFYTSDTPGQIKILENPYDTYHTYITQRFQSKRKPRVVVDCGNGTAGLFAEKLLTGLGCDVVRGLYMEPDAKFPNHIPDPESPENMKDLMEAVVNDRADFGIAFDADGDRVGFIDEKGGFRFADELLLIMARDTLRRYPHKKILFDVKCSRLLEELLPGMNGIPFMHCTGHAPIKATLRSDPEVILGGEIASHYFFSEDYYKIDDAFFAVA